MYGVNCICKHAWFLSTVVDGVFGSWSAWSACSQTCGAGSQSRSRQCDNPTPRNGGAPCVTTSGMNTSTTETVDRSCTVTECQGTTCTSTISHIYHATMLQQDGKCLVLTTMVVKFSYDICMILHKCVRYIAYVYDICTIVRTCERYMYDSS